MSPNFSDGINQFRKKLENLQNAIQKGEIPFGDLFNPHFMRRYSTVSTIEALFEAGGHNPTTQAELERMDESALDLTIRQYTNFSSWSEMKKVAGEEWMKRKFES